MSAVLWIPAISGGKSRSFSAHFVERILFLEWIPNPSMKVPDIEDDCDPSRQKWVLWVTLARQHGFFTSWSWHIKEYAAVAVQTEKCQILLAKAALADVTGIETTDLIASEARMTISPSPRCRSDC